MPYYLHTIQGLLNASFPWSMTAVSFASGNEAATQSIWDTAALAMWTSSGLNGIIPTTTSLTKTTTSTATASFKQSTLSFNNHTSAGGSASASLPYHNCPIITFRSLLATRYGRGRWYFPALATNALASGGYVLSATALTDLQTAFNAFFTALGSSITLQILHRHGGGGGAAAPDSLSPVVAADIPNTFAVQRRRADKLVPTRTTITV